MSFRVAGARDCAPCLKWAKREGFVAFQNTMAGGTFEGNLQRCILRVRRSTKDTWVRHVRRSGRWFPDRGFILEHQIFRFAEVVLRDRCSTSYDHFFVARLNGKIAKRGTRLSIFEGSLTVLLHFWCCQVPKLRKPGRISSLWRWELTILEQVWQNFLVLELCTAIFWGSLVELLRFTERDRDRQTDRKRERER